MPGFRACLAVFLLGCCLLGSLAGCPAENAPSKETTETASGSVADPKLTERGKPTFHDAWFENITADSKLAFSHQSGEIGNRNMPAVMAGGAAFFDADQDGDLDIYLTNGRFMFGDAEPATQPINRFYLQQADRTFVDVTSGSGLGDAGYGMGVAVGDIDNDGDRDVYLSNYGPDRLFRNRGDGAFDDITVSAGIDVPGYSASAAFLDFDRDGLLDIYITQYVAYDPAKRCTDQSGRHVFCGPKAFPPIHDVLLHNKGESVEPQFEDVSKAAGLHSVSAGAGLGVVCNDFNDDGWIDVYVANDGYANHLWINRGDGTFAEEAMLSGIALNMQGQAEAGMGVTVGDFDNDGLHDLFITHLGGETNTLYRALPVGGFEDATGGVGLGSASLPYTGFGIGCFDIELDGDLDILVANGRVQRGMRLDGAQVAPPWDELAEPSLLFVNDGSGRFDTKPELAPGFCNPLRVARGIAVGDIDGDGDIDMLATQIDGPAWLFRNDAPRQGHWLMVEAWDPALRREAIGARIVLECGPRHYVGTVMPSSSYLCSSDPRVHFGLGAAEAYESISVRWPDGDSERFPGGTADRVIRLERGNGDGG